MSAAWWRDARELSPEEEAELTRREEEEQRRAADLRRREQLAAGFGFDYPGPGTDPPIPRVCPTCGAMVPLSMVERHHDWHLDQRP